MLEARDISKRYGTIAANDCLSISILPGEVLGMLGENGAGKSTLLSILAGMVQPDSGHLLIDGARVSFRSPADAIRCGIGTVYQHFSLVPTFTVHEQLRLAGWRSASLPEMLRNRMSGKERIDHLSLGERQQVEIAKAMLSRPRILLLDEPTSILTPDESVRLLETARTFRTQGTSVVLVTHKLREAMGACDRIVVMRQGAVAGTVERSPKGWANDCEERLLRFMFGPDVARSTRTLWPPATPDRERIQGETGQTIEQHDLFRATSITIDAKTGTSPLRNVTLTVNSGQVCVIVGIDGHGQRELAEVCTGHRRASGTLAFRGHTLPFGKAARFQRAGIGYLTDDRLGEGGVPKLSVAFNLVLKRHRVPRFSKLGNLRKKSILADARMKVMEWSISPPSVDTPFGLLSGGNMQKVLLAREIATSPRMLIANKPTQGLDVRTQAIVWRALREVASRAGGVLVFSTDLDEARSQADRIAVMFGGRVSSLVPVDSIDRATLARMMVSGW